MRTQPDRADASDRKAIVDALDETLVVEAAAGTGKTTELVCRIVRVIETGRAQISEIVAVSFTEKAAGELKLRLRQALEDARGQKGAGTIERRRLDEALRALEQAHISTIHGFCADLLRERPVEAGIDPLFSVLTEPQADAMYSAAFDQWFQHQLLDPPEGIRRALRRPGFVGFGPATDADEGPVERLRRAGLDLASWRDFDADWSRQPFDRQARVDALVQQMREFVALASTPTSPYDNLYQDTRPVRQIVEQIARTETVVARDYDGLESAIVGLIRNRQFQRARKGTGRVYRDGVAREDVWGAREKLQAALGDFEMAANADLAALLHQELRGAVESYRQAKAQAGALDFLDLLLEARTLLHDNGEVRHTFQQRFKRIFVDEFQDTDPLQAEILLLLSADDPSVTEWREVRPVPGKLFLVGDPKQSIYRFRRADVSIYRSVYRMLEAAGARRVTLRTSFRARPNIQRAINAAFAPRMTGEESTLQADYVPLEPARDDAPEQPSVVVLPVPRPYATQRIAAGSIENSLPDAVGAFVEWVIDRSGWRVSEHGFTTADSEHLVPIQARHICLLFRRFVSFGQDMTRRYLDALEARSIPHLLVGGRSFHGRAEIETLRAALAAIEWPDDELSVFATLKGSLFAIGDEELFEYRHRFGHFHPFRIPKELHAPDQLVPDGEWTRLVPIVEALQFLGVLHRDRNRAPVATTMARLLERTRAHVRFALEHSGEQVLANVTHLAEMARRYEADGGISFRGFIDELRSQALHGEVSEAPILEDGSDGVRMMTVHKAKGLEFPVVILADMTAKIRAAAASRYLDPRRRLCAIRLAGCSPDDLRLHEAEELGREASEGVRIAYVAATRARDLLVVPAIGDEEREGWIEPLNAAVYPVLADRRKQVPALGCPAFRFKDTVLERPGGDTAGPQTVCPGLHLFTEAASGQPYGIVWWDPRALDLDVEPPPGIRHPELIVKDVPPEVVEAGMAEYRTWLGARDSALSSGSGPSLAVQTVTQWARGSGLELPETGNSRPDPEIVTVGGDVNRPSGRRFGTLVHGVLATAPFEHQTDLIAELANSHGRALGATEEEEQSAIALVRAAFAHPLLQRARHAARAGKCRREVPIAWRQSDHALLEGIVDLAFEEDGRWTVIDFKTDDEPDESAADYHRQLSLYALAIQTATDKPAAAVLVRL